jgi:hypothetical protein
MPVNGRWDLIKRLEGKKEISRPGIGVSELG